MANLSPSETLTIIILFQEWFMRVLFCFPVLLVKSLLRMKYLIRCIMPSVCRRNTSRVIQVARRNAVRFKHAAQRQHKGQRALSLPKRFCACTKRPLFTKKQAFVTIMESPKYPCKIRDRRVSILPFHVRTTSPYRFIFRNLKNAVFVEQCTTIFVYNAKNDKDYVRYLLTL